MTDFKLEPQLNGIIKSIYLINPILSEAESPALTVPASLYTGALKT